MGKFKILIMIVLIFIVVIHCISFNDKPADPGDESYYIILAKSVIQTGEIRLLHYFDTPIDNIGRFVFIYLISPLVKLSNNFKYIPVRIENMFFYIFGLIVFYITILKYFNRSFNYTEIIFILLLTGLWPWALKTSSTLLTEPLFFLESMILIYLVYSIQESRVNINKFLFITLFSVVAIFTRISGYLFIMFIFILLIKEKYYKYFFYYFIIIMLSLFIYHQSNVNLDNGLINPNNNANYTKSIYDGILLIIKNPMVLIKNFIVQLSSIFPQNILPILNISNNPYFNYPIITVLCYLIGSFITIFYFIFYFYCEDKKIKFLYVLLIINVIMLSSREDLISKRHYLFLNPYIILTSVMMIKRYLKKYVKYALISLMIFTIIPDLDVINDSNKEYMVEKSRPEYEIYEWINRNSIIGTKSIGEIRPRGYYLYTGNKITYLSRHTEFVKYFINNDFQGLKKEEGIDYIIIYEDNNNNKSLSNYYSQINSSLKLIFVTQSYPRLEVFIL